MVPSKLVEVAGTPFINQKDPLDNGGVVDFFQGMGFTNPRPVFFQRITDTDYKSALSNHVIFRRTVDSAASAIENLELSASQQWKKEVEHVVKVSLKHNHSPGAVITTLRYYLAALNRISKLASDERQPDKSTNTRLWVLSGGIFQAMILNELARQQGTISDQEAGEVIKRLTPLLRKKT